jgi:hypothetical protein
MKRQATICDLLLARRSDVQLSLETMNADELKRATRFWYGKTATTMRKVECIRALTDLARNKERLKQGLASLTDRQKTILGVVSHFGGCVSGNLLQCELHARGLIEESKRRPQPLNSRARDDDPVYDLCSKLLLIPPGQSGWFELNYHSYGRWYPALALLPGVRELVSPTPPLRWRSSGPGEPPGSSWRRPAAAVALDLWTIAHALAQMGTWKTNRGGALSKSVQNRLRGLLAVDDQDPLTPPHVEILYYEMLRGLAAIRVERDHGTIDLAVLERNLGQPEPVQGWHWARAWLGTPLWQDGIGAVPDRDSDYDPVRIRPAELATARELVTWALNRVAQGLNDWLDLESMLTELWAVQGESTVHFYWHGYTWDPAFAPATNKDKFPVGPERSRAFWLDSEGTWAANAIVVTLAHLGMVERGFAGTHDRTRPCFRLTELGCAVFGALERATGSLLRERRFLTIQPNHEILAYLDVAEASTIYPLARFASRTSSGQDRVQRFVLTRESVYGALEAGMSNEQIEKFLQEHSKTGLPDLVARSLAEWTQKREALVIHPDVTLFASTPEQRAAFRRADKGRLLGDRFMIAPRSALPSGKNARVCDHTGEQAHTWEVDEAGMVQTTGELDSIARARLSQIAEPSKESWQITAASVRRARERGITAESILSWLQDHLVRPLPPLVETMIRNWGGAATTFLGSLLLLQVRQPQAAAAILSSRRFRPFVVGQVSPDWFILRAEHKVEVEHLLQETGFTISQDYQLTTAAVSNTRPEPSRSRGKKRSQSESTAG